MRIVPFEAAVAQPVLDDLRDRLARTRWPAWPRGESWAEGTDPGYLRDLVSYWASEYDWRRAETRLNRFRQYRADIDGLQVHFIHERGKGPRPLPLIITHGWPGGVFEMLELIPRLTDAFDVVVPSLPGYGFSDPPATPGTHPRAIGRLWLRLMTEGLGYSSFGAQGGDWGATVATWLAIDAPDRVLGIHLNYLPGSYRPWLGDGPPLSPAERSFRDAADSWAEAEGAYAHLQRTKPLSAAYALQDSRAGLAAWIVEKLHSWSDCGGDLGRRFDRDQVLDMVTLYWVTGTIGSSMRLYLEASRHPLRLASGQRIAVPTGLALFPAETPANPPRGWVERGYDVRRWETMPRGGHFAAWEEPDLLANEIRAFFQGLRPEA